MTEQKPTEHTHFITVPMGKNKSNNRAYTKNLLNKLHFAETFFAANSSN